MGAPRLSDFDGDTSMLAHSKGYVHGGRVAFIEFLLSSGRLSRAFENHKYVRGRRDALVRSLRMWRRA